MERIPRLLSNPWEKDRLLGLKGNRIGALKKTTSNKVCHSTAKIPPSDPKGLPKLHIRVSRPGTTNCMRRALCKSQASIIADIILRQI